MPPSPTRLRKAYANLEHPSVVLRFEDGHEIKVPKGKVKTFDAYAGEVVKVLAIHDPRQPDRDLLQSIRSEEFPDAEEHESR